MHAVDGEEGAATEYADALSHILDTTQCLPSKVWRARGDTATATDVDLYFSADDDDASSLEAFPSIDPPPPQAQAQAQKSERTRPPPQKSFVETFLSLFGGCSFEQDHRD